MKSVIGVRRTFSWSVEELHVRNCIGMSEGSSNNVVWFKGDRKQSRFYIDEFNFGIKERTNWISHCRIIAISATLLMDLNLYKVIHDDIYCVIHVLSLSIKNSN